MTHAVLNPVGGGGAGSIADWLELAMFVSGRRLLTPGKAAEVIGVGGSSRDPADIGFAFAALHARANRGLDLYPFSFSKFGLQLRLDVDATAYRVLVALAAASEGSLSLGSGSNVASIEFERLVTAAGAALFGMGESVRFGSPPEPERPTTFERALDWVADLLGARVLGIRGSARDRADGGIDAIAWRRFGGRGPAGPIALIQATYEGDVRRKSLEIAANEFSRWVDVGARTVPVLATPASTEDDADLFEELNARVLTLERWRILQLLAETEWRPNPATSSWIDSLYAGLSL